MFADLADLDGTGLPAAALLRTDGPLHSVNMDGDKTEGAVDKMDSTNISIRGLFVYISLTLD